MNWKTIKQKCPKALENFLKFLNHSFDTKNPEFRYDEKEGQILGSTDYLIHERELFDFFDSVNIRILLNYDNSDGLKWLYEIDVLPNDSKEFVCMETCDAKFIARTNAESEAFEISFLLHQYFLDKGVFPFIAEEEEPKVEVKEEVVPEVEAKEEEPVVEVKEEVVPVVEGKVETGKCECGKELPIEQLTSDGEGNLTCPDCLKDMGNEVLEAKKIVLPLMSDSLEAMKSSGRVIIKSEENKFLCHYDNNIIHINCTEDTMDATLASIKIILRENEIPFTDEV